MSTPTTSADNDEGRSKAFPIKLAKIGVQCTNQNESIGNPNIVSFREYRFKLITKNKRIIKDIDSIPELCCEALNISNDKEVTLWLMLFKNFEHHFWKVNRNFAAVRRVMNEFFIVPRKNFFDENEDENGDGNDDDGNAECQSFISLVDNMYNHLQDAHTAADNRRSTSDKYSNEYIQHEFLEVKLKPYQVKTIEWMLDREQMHNNQTILLNSGFVEVKRRSLDPSLTDDPIRFFYNRETATLTTNPNVITESVALPNGGILAEEMGMGKTIEILNLILLNPRTHDSSQLESMSENEGVASGSLIPPSKKPRKRSLPKSEGIVSGSSMSLPRPSLSKSEGVVSGSSMPTPKPTDIRCVCHLYKIVGTVACTKCSKYQHRKCVDQWGSKGNPDSAYICPECWLSEERIAAKTTLVISPQSIKHQWKAEVENRIKSGKLSIFVYVGSKSCKWISPRVLASYDIILIDYETCRSELMYTHHNSCDRVLRNTPAFIKRQSPLLKLNFWRICLDESQMVVNMESSHALLIWALSAVHRWAVTGTPIETSLNDLFGLISFINYAPYDSRSVWDSIVNYLTRCSPDYESLVSILLPIMRRTCKTEGIINEMDVPEQIEVVHYVELSCLDRYQYNQKRDQCRSQLNQVIRFYHLETPLRNLSPGRLEMILEPVRTLRRICSILHESDDEGNTIILRPAHMLQYLINTNESMTNFALKQIAKKTKNFVQLSMGNHWNRKDVLAETLKTCRGILNWAKTYEKEPIMTSSLLQIQTVNNLRLIDNGNFSTTDYAAELKEMEKHLNKNQLDCIVNFRNERQKEITKFTSYELYFTQNCLRWALAALSDEKFQTMTINEIRTRAAAAYADVGSTLASYSSISNTLSYWCNDLLKQRKEFKHAFEKFFESAVKTKSKSGEGRQSSECFLNLYREAVDCHLNKVNPVSLAVPDSVDDIGSVQQDTDSADDDNKDGRPREMKVAVAISTKQCILCSASNRFKVYATYISDRHKRTKKAKDRRKFTNPSLQEFVLKVILQSNNLSGNIDTKVGIQLLTILEYFRNEFQQHQNLLSSIIKNVANFHAVQMSKPPKPTATNQPREMIQWLHELEKNKITYENKVRVNRYLNCMERWNDGVDECLICTLSINQYTVFECGHQCCRNCFNRIRQGDQFRCPFCFKSQPAQKCLQFTFDTTEKFTDFSNKIEHIVRKVHQLMSVDQQVKILIFSQWIDILGTLQGELSANGIASRYTLGGKSLLKVVDEFKNPILNITCLLLPYRIGSRGINLIEATHVFLVEPIINRGYELQALGRVHRIGQTRQTCVHRFIMKNTIEETIFNVMSTQTVGLLSSEKCTVKTLVDLFADTNGPA